MQKQKSPVLIRETPEQRQAIINAIFVNGQRLGDADFLQTDRIVGIKVPDGFRGIVYPDSHSPYEDTGVLRAIWDFAALWQPHMAFDLGDIIDLSFLSRWPANARGGQPFSQQDEFESARRQLRQKARAGNPEKLVVIPGNHDDRVRQQISGDSAKFSRLMNGGNREFLTDVVTNLLGFDDKDKMLFAWGIGQTGGREGGVMVGDFRLRHGNYVNAKPGYAAYTHWLRQLVNIIMGHVHRAGDFAVETRSGQVARGAEVGHTFNTKSPGANYLGADNDWVHAFGVLTCVNGVVNMQVVPFLQGYDEHGRLREYATWVDADKDADNQIVEFAVQDM